MPEGRIKLDGSEVWVTTTEVSELRHDGTFISKGEVIAHFRFETSKTSYAQYVKDGNSCIRTFTSHESAAEAAIKEVILRKKWERVRPPTLNSPY